MENIAAIQRLVRAVEDNSPETEPYHARDCPACDLADEIIGSLAVYWADDEEWFTSITDWSGGMSIADQGVRIVAHVLHRRLNVTPRKV